MNIGSKGTALSTRSAVGAFLLFLLLTGLAPFTLGQSTATLQGTVTDPAGGGVPDASVAAIDEATGVRKETRTDSVGVYLFPSLIIGPYKLEVSKSGFQTTVVSGLKLEVASTMTRNVQLSLGQTSQTIEVSAGAPLVETANNSEGQVINDKYVQQIPLNGRHFTDLALLTPGTVTSPANGFLTFPLRGQGSFAVDTAGQREDTTNWLVNGINMNDNVQNQITFQPPISTLAEFRIDNSSFPAQYGRNSGAIVNMATRSGTNDYHGELFEFLRNNALDARNFFNVDKTTSGKFLPQSPFSRNEFGGDGGGPIIHNKLFFFVAYEGLRQHQSIPLSTPVPSFDDRNPATPLAPAIQKLLTLVPPANLVGTGNPADPNTFNLFSGGTAARVALNQGSADIDYELRQTDRLHAYYVVQKDLRQEPTAGGNVIGANLPGFGDTRDGFRQLMTFSEDHTFSPSLNNTVRLGYNRIHLSFTPNGLLNPADFDMMLPAGAPVGSGLPFFNVGGALGFGGPLNDPSARGDTTVALNDGVSWLKGRHTFMFGGEIRRAYNNNIALNIGQITYLSQAQFLADGADAFTLQLGSGNDKILQPSYDVFVQDSFKVLPNLTLNYGLRYAWNATPSESQNRFSNFDPKTGNLFISGQPYQQNNTSFQPRFGFAWDPLKDGKMSVRGGYAILTQAPTTNTVTGLSADPPFALPISVNSASHSITAENPTAALKAPSIGPLPINSGFNNAYSQDWNLSVQRQLTNDLGLEVAYVGVKGTHLQLVQNINQPLVVNGFYNAVRPYPSLPATSPVFPAQCVPTCLYGNINQVNSAGNSLYNGLWITANKHVSHGLQFLATYTLSKSLDYNSLSSGETYTIQNAYNPRGDRGLSEFDVRNRVVVSGFYTLPFKGNRLVSGWQVGTVFQAQTGNPVNPTLAIGPGPGISLTVRPDLLGRIHTTGNNHPTNYFANAVLCEPFNGTPMGGPSSPPNCATTPNATLAVPCTFGTTPISTNSKGISTYPVIPGSCHPGSLGRDAITGPGFVNTDFSITKDTKILERLNLQFRTDMFDVFNHENFGNPVLTATSGSFGLIQSTRFPTGDFGSSRQIQFSLLLQF